MACMLFQRIFVDQKSICLCLYYIMKQILNMKKLFLIDLFTELSSCDCRDDSLAFNVKNMKVQAIARRSRP